jgi:hypothetical protein
MLDDQWHASILQTGACTPSLRVRSHDQLRFHPISKALYMLDFGNFEMHAERGVVAENNTGKLWRLTLEE